MTNQPDRPKVGIGTLIFRGDKILLGRRLSSHGAGTWQIPGGHLEFGESFEECAVREGLEETGLTDLRAIDIVSVSNDIAYDKHYITVGVLVESKHGEPTSPETEHSSEWHWHDPNDLPKPMFAHSERTVKNWLSNQIYNKDNN